MSTAHRAILGSRRLHWRDEADCRSAAAALAADPALRSAAIELRGPLGAGKTSFARHLLRALGVEGRIKSPSYALMEPYELPGLDAWHFDFYRFDDPREWEDAGFRDIYASPGLKIAEWPEKAAGLLPAPDLRIGIEPTGETAREVTADACSPLGVRLLAALGTASAAASTTALGAAPAAALGAEVVP